MKEKLREFREWQKPMRLRTVGYAVILYFVAVRITRLTVPFWWYLLIAAFIGTGGAATMSENDLHDRFHDRKKGKNFAYDNVKKLRLMVSWLWIISVALAVAIFFLVDKPLGILSFVLLALGFLYSYTLRMKYVPGVYVAMTSTGPLLYAFVLQPTWQTGLLILATLPFILGRETLKDLNDMENDWPHKWTPPVAYGSRTSKVIVGCLYSIAAAVMLLVSYIALQPAMRLLPTAFIFIALTLLLVAIVMLFANKHHKVPKGLADASMVIVMFTLVVFV